VVGDVKQAALGPLELVRPLGPVVLFVGVLRLLVIGDSAVRDARHRWLGDGRDCASSSSISADLRPLHAARGGEHVAADLPHIDRELADRRAGIEQIEDAVTRGDIAEPPCFGTCVITIRFVRGTDRVLGHQIERVLSSPGDGSTPVNMWSSCVGEYRLYRRSQVLRWGEA
jgi:hypothetical protein